MAERQVRWVAYDSEQEPALKWNQLKKVKSGERELLRGSDRNLRFSTPEPNPDFVKPEDRTEGEEYTEDQLRETNEVRKHPEAQEEKLNAAAASVAGVLQKIATGEVVRWFYSAEAGIFRYTTREEVEGETFENEQETQDETVLEAVEEFLETLTEEVASEGKPLTVAIPPEPVVEPEMGEVDLTDGDGPSYDQLRTGERTSAKVRPGKSVDQLRKAQG